MSVLLTWQSQSQLLWWLLTDWRSLWKDHTDQSNVVPPQVLPWSCIWVDLCRKHSSVHRRHGPNPQLNVSFSFCLKNWAVCGVHPQAFVGEREADLCGRSPGPFSAWWEDLSQLPVWWQQDDTHSSPDRHMPWGQFEWKAAGREGKAPTAQLRCSQVLSSEVTAILLESQIKINCVFFLHNLECLLSPAG